MFIFYSDNDQGDTLPVDPTSDLFSVNNPSQGDILSYDGSHFTNTNILSGSNIDLINIDPNNLTGTIPYARLPNLAEITLSGNAVPPYIASITPITPTGTQNIEIIGEYFSPITQLNIPGVTVNSLEVRSPTKIVASISKTGLSGNKTITLSNGLNSNQLWAEGIKSVSIAVDPHWANVILFLKGNGQNNSTNIIDDSPNPKILTRVGDTKISSIQSKYGGSSIFLDGNNDYLTFSDNGEFDFNGDFTIEAWVYPVAISTYFPLYEGRISPDYNLVCGIWNVSGVYKLDFVSPVGTRLTTSLNVPLNQWNHVAFTRQGSIIRAFLNGVVNPQTISVSGAINTLRSNPMIGSTIDIPPSFANGYIDSFRITKGVARYTANFNPETDSYLNI